MPDQAKPPRMVHALDLQLRAATLDGLVAELEHWLFRLRTQEFVAGETGWIGSGDRSSIYAYRFDPEMTPERYRENIVAWLMRRGDATTR